jgi:hypothetical protein
MPPNGDNHRSKQAAAFAVGVVVGVGVGFGLASARGHGDQDSTTLWCCVKNNKNGTSLNQSGSPCTICSAGQTCSCKVPEN